MTANLHKGGLVNFPMGLLRIIEQKSRVARRITGEVVLVSAFTIFVCASAFGQSTGTINGSVLDATGAVVPDATVTATNTGTNVVRTTTTNSDGLYSFVALEPAQYDVRVEIKGFASSVRKGATLLTGSTLTLDFT